MLFTAPNSLEIFYDADKILKTYSKYFHAFPTPSAHSGNHFLKHQSILGCCFLRGGHYLAEPLTLAKIFHQNVLAV
jgi:hypothetical protein